MRIGTNCFLVTGANGDIASAIGRVLLSSFPDAKVVGCDLGASWPGRSVFEEMYTLPRAEDSAYLASLKKLSQEIEATCIIPCTEPELEKIVSHWESVSELPLLINDPDFVRIGLDKFATNTWLSSLGLNTPKTLQLKDAVSKDLPLFIKPRIGSGSRNLEIVKTESRLLVCRNNDHKNNMVAQELLEPNLGEYTCAILKKGSVVRILIMQRWLSGGLTSQMVVVENKSIKNMLQTVADNLSEIAAINVQLRLTHDGPRIFEINPRLSSTVMMRHKVGFNDLVWWINALNGEEPSLFSVPVGYHVYRTYNEIVVLPDEL